MGVQAYIGLGSNLNQPIIQLKTALNAMSTLEASKLIAVSHFYRSRPLGNLDQPFYINAVVELTTSLSAEQLLDGLQQIELQQGRVRSQQQWMSRHIDLDIILFANEQINSPRLTIPHPGLKKREFWIFPLSEINRDLILPNGEKIANLCDFCDRNGMEDLGKQWEIS